MKFYYPVLVLDKSYRSVSIFSHRKAFILHYLDKCEVLEFYSEITIKSPEKEFKAPLVIRIPVFLHHWETKKPTRRAVFIRDNFRCGYCGKEIKDSNLTVDHIIPRSRGGEWTWENLITCCKECNQRKQNKLPDEADMPLLFKPFAPSGFQITFNKWKKRFSDEFVEILQIYGAIGSKSFLKI